jgi:hypothetical protein
VVTRNARQSEYEMKESSYTTYQWIVSRSNNNNKGTREHALMCPISAKGQWIEGDSLQFEREYTWPQEYLRTQESSFSVTSACVTLHTAIVTYQRHRAHENNAQRTRA